ncbi:hypothetical protein OYC64_001863 [Pagothenia borchgrevinki]|uniref:G protein-regulated inducer of neurite outgrowth C-terminal domain-containing protein n=1 Tax=Pagothenia borchgrevinki TaxID=8213 RepID=A0ABD2GCM7_PAGBO
MARPRRPASENYQPVWSSVSQSVSYSSGANAMVSEDGDDHAGILSLSKSSMDVVMATVPPHMRDPAWIGIDLRRSSSTNTHLEQNSVTLQKLHPRMWQHINSANTDMHKSPPDLHRWSESSTSTHSRSSTPDTIVWKGGTSRPSSLTQETPCSPFSKMTTYSPFMSPLEATEDVLTSSSSTLTLSPQHQVDLHAPSPSPLQSPRRALTASPLPPHSPSHSPNLLQPTNTEDEGFLENNSLSFIFPSPIPSSVSLAGLGASTDPECLDDGVIEELYSPGGSQFSRGGEVMSPGKMLGYQTPNSPADGQESERGASVSHLELPWQQGQSRGWTSPLVSSLSDSLLGDCCRCNLNSRESITKAPEFREEGTMTTQRELVDAAVQTVSPYGSLWGLKRDTSNMGSHSFLGSPPGSRLNLKTLVGSNSNLVSPSSSMFPANSREGEEQEERQGDDPTWDVNSTSSLHNHERRRSCLKMKIFQGVERDQFGRRGSMKQVQWDEDGMTWDVHGASVDPQELSTAIRKHLEIQNSPRFPKLASMKKKAPMPPLLSNVVKVFAPEHPPPVAIITSTFTGMGEADEGRNEVEGEGRGQKEGRLEAARRLSRAEAPYAIEDDEVYGDEISRHPKSTLHGSGKKRSLRRPGWCGSSRNEDD